MGKDNNLVIVVAALLVLAVATGYIKLPSGQAQSAVGTGTGAAVSAGTLYCGDDKLADLSVRINNKLDAGNSYIAPAVTYALAGSGKAVATITPNTDGTFATSANVLNCGEKYKLYILNSASVVSASSPEFAADEAIERIEMTVANSSAVEFAVFSSAYANQTVGFRTDGVGNITDSLAANGVLTKIVRYRAATGTAQFGSDELNTFICADFSLARFSITNGVSVDRSDWVVTTLPKRCSSAGHDKAWRIPAVKATEGERDVKITLRADLGDPVSTDSNPRFLAVDEATYRAQDGTVKIGTEDDTATDIGETNVFIELSLA